MTRSRGPDMPDTTTKEDDEMALFTTTDEKEGEPLDDGLGVEQSGVGVETDMIDLSKVDPDLLTDPLDLGNTQGLIHHHTTNNHSHSHSHSHSHNSNAGDIPNTQELSDRVLSRDSTGAVVGWNEDQLDHELIANTDEDNIRALQYVSNLSRLISQHPKLPRPSNFPSYNTLTGIRTRLKGLGDNATVLKKEGDDRCTLCKTNGRPKTAKVTLGCWVQEGAWTSCAGCQSRGRSGDCSFSRSSKRRTEKKERGGSQSQAVGLLDVVGLGESVVEYGTQVNGLLASVPLDPNDRETVTAFETKLREFEAMIKIAKRDDAAERASEESNANGDESPETLNSTRKRRKGAVGEE